MAAVDRAATGAASWRWGRIRPDRSRPPSRRGDAGGSAATPRLGGVAAPQSLDGEARHPAIIRRKTLRWPEHGGIVA
ncbi:hypothetical protein WG70_12630 [Burkholderia oklahomensis EO147]|nr:hypothetical protein WG70_12630 [Burkholderia oklahomensis EO147]KUY52981.1 hypothetical protein WG70_14440 [Burkholderia oklahomensis EO147]